MPPGDSTVPSLPSTRFVLFPFALAIVDTLIVWRGMNTLVPDGSLSLLVAAIAVLFGVSSIVAAFRLPTLSYWGVVLLMLGGIFIGIVVDVVVDASLFSVDRNLLGLEIAFVWLVSVVPIAIGTFVGRSLHARRHLGTRA